MQRGKASMMDVRVLGPIEVHSGHQLAIGGPNQRRIVATLAMHANTVVSTDRLTELTWPDRTPSEQTEANLRSYVYRVRNGLGDDLADRIATRAPGYVLHADRDELDYRRFEDLVERAERVGERNDPGSAMAYVGEALDLWRGEPYQEFADEEWAAAEVTRLHELRARAIECRCASLVALDRAGEAIADLEALIDEHPFRERPRHLLMVSLYRAGRQAEALRAFQTFRDLLVEELGIDPSTDLVALEQSILEQDPVLTEGGPTRSLRSYELDEVIGEGAFALVWRGTQPDLGRAVAVKQIRAELANQPDFIRRFEVEAQLVASLEHPHIVPLYDYWREPDAAYLVMRLLPRGTLEAHVLDRTLDDAELRRLVFQVGAALRAAHRAGVIHRDVRSANVLLDDEGNFYLSDFGIAFGVDGEDAAALAMSTGSPAYASPEQLRRLDLDPRSDIYALGITLFEAATGRLPFAYAESHAAMVRAQLEDPIPLPSSMVARVPAWVDQIVARATAKAPQDRYASIDELIASLPPEAGAPVVDAEQRAVTPVPFGEARNPFKALEAFGEADAADFRGRERLVTRMVEVLQRPGSAGRLLAAVGPSGSGKSSAVRAGLIPAIRADAIPGSSRWFVTTMVPGRRPFEELESALLRVAPRAPGPMVEMMRSDERGVARAVNHVVPEEDAELLLLVDQFEELFTLTDAEERRQFLDGLVSAIRESRSRMRVVVTIRADFWDRPLAHPALASMLETAALTVAPLSPDELEQVIVDPVEAQGFAYEPGLVARIIADVTDRPGSLPLLQYTLTELYNRNTSGLLTAAAYEAVGGVGGALARRADETYERFDDEQRQAARRLLGRLVSLGEGVEDTRRRVTASGLRTDPSTASVIEAFGTARLLTFDRDPATRERTVEIAHEALLREWPRLAEWIDEDRDGLRVQRAITEAADRWEAAGRQDADVFRGGRLEAALEYSVVHPDELNHTEEAFVDASLQLCDREADRTRRTNRRLRRLAAAVSVVAVLAVIAGAIALVQRSDAQDAQAEAELARSEAESNAQEAESARAEADSNAQEAELARGEAESNAQAADNARAGAETARMAAEAPAIVDADPQLGLLLAVEAHRRDPSAATLGALQRTMLGMGTRLGYIGDPDLQYLNVEWSDDGTVLVALHEAGIEVYETATYELRWSADVVPLTHRSGRPSPAGDYSTFELDGSGRYAAVATDDGGVTLFDLEAQTATILAHPEPATAVAFDHGSHRVATGDRTGTVRIWDLMSESVSIAFEAHPEGWPAYTEEMLEAGFDSEWYEETFVPGAGEISRRGVANMVFAPDDSVLITAESPVLRMWDPDTGSPVDDLSEFVALAGFGRFPRPPLMASAFEPDPKDPDVVVAQSGTVLVRYDWRTGELVEDLPLPTGRQATDTNVREAGGAATPDGGRVVSLSDGRLTILDPEGNASGTVQHRLARPAAVAVSPDGRLATVAGLGGLALVSLDGSGLLATGIDRVPGADTFSISGDGGYVTQGGFITGTQLYRRTDDGIYRVDSLPQVAAEGATGVVSLPDGRTLLSTYVDGADEPGVWFDPATGEVIESGQFGDGFGSGFSSNGVLFASWNFDRQLGVTIVDTTDWGIVAELGDLPAALPALTYIRSVAFDSSDARLLATTQEGVVGLWDAETWEPLGLPRDLDLGQVVVASFSPNGRFLATVDTDGQITIRDATSFEPLTTLDGANAPSSTGQDIRWLSGELMISEFDDAPRLWDVEAGIQIGDPFPNDPNVSYNGSESALVTAVGDWVHVWNTDVDSWPDIACRAAGRNMTQAEWDQVGPDGEDYRVTCPEWPVGA